MIAELKALVISELNLEDLTPDDIDEAAPLFGEGLGLDSIDALELAIVLDKRYGVKISPVMIETPRFSPPFNLWPISFRKTELNRSRQWAGCYAPF